MRNVIISNRLPIVVEKEAGSWVFRVGSGGLVTALHPVLRDYGGLWIGWPGTTSDEIGAIEEVLRVYRLEAGYEVQPVWLTQAERDGFYHGFSNEIIWPLFHDLQSRCNFVPDYWTSYLAVNEKFAAAVALHARADDFLWVQDYHLMGLGRLLRARGMNNRIGFFLHIPFPPPDIFLKLPWRSEVLEGLLEYDLIGFQTPRDCDNFSDCIRRIQTGARLRRRPGGLRITRAGRESAAGVFPIGIDYGEFARGATGPDVAARSRDLRAEVPNQQILLGVDRLDYTKGVPYRLRAFALALERYPALHRKATLLQFVIPSRTSVPEYQDLHSEIEQLVTKINGRFTQPGWVPIHYFFRSLERSELLAYYRAADVALVTPLKDGMNLIAKEYCACQIDDDGVLILSEFAGAAVQMRHGAVLVNSYDLNQVAEAIWSAVNLTAAQRRPAMRRLRSGVRRQDVHWWLARFLTACGALPAGLAGRRPVATHSSQDELAAPPGPRTETRACLS